MTSSQERPKAHGKITIQQVGDILDLLVRDLYGNDPHLTLRELIQNAHDALVELPQTAQLHAKPIMIRLNDLSDSPYIEVIDHGIGMSREDIETKLCVVGNTDKLHSPNLEKIIGRYGIGFLSSFIIADHVEVSTCKYGSSDPLLWRTEDKETWTLEPCTGLDFPHGTRVRLYFRRTFLGEDNQRLNDLRYVDGVEGVVKQHCYLLPVPIQIAQANVAGARRVNAQHSPWDDKTEARHTFHALFGTRNEPLYIHQFKVDDPHRKLSAAGVLYFRDEIFSSLAVRLHVKRMLVDSHVNRLLPSYAPYVQGVVECPGLKFDLARRTVPDFDPTYRWLRGVIAKECEKAFIRFAEKQPDDFFLFWPDVDLTVIGRLLRQLHLEEDEVGREHAESFLLAAAKYFPFYVVDEYTGAQGRPVWKSIDDLMSSARRRGDDESAEKVEVFYSDSKNPVEKDMLLTQYSEIIDVGRTEKRAHQLLIDQLAFYNDRFTDFQLRKVTINRFNPIDQSERDSWADLVEEVQKGLFFGTRSHDVQVETFEPSSTPVVITDSYVDPEILESYRQQVETMSRAQGAEHLASQIMRLVESMQRQEGGVLTIHLNAQNPMMQRLRSAAYRDVATLGLMSVCWRAVLDYFGWNSTRQMLLREKKFTEQLVMQLLDLAARRDAANTRADEIEAEAVSLRDQVAVLSKKIAPRSLNAFVGVLDIAGSTARIVSNPSASPEQKIGYLRELLTDIKLYLREFATVIGFTGDGMQFYLEADGESRHNLRVALGQGLLHRIGTLPERNEEVRRIMEDAHIVAPRLRVALAFGLIYVGDIISPQDLMGLPAVQATRICAQEEWYSGSKTALLITEEAYDRGSASKLWRAADFSQVSEVTLSGMATPITLYKPVVER
ncbi:ATP-binding protein [Nonomuraea wenchangensis]